jgi:hypothetical protein
MGALTLADAREYVFPIFSVQAESNGIFIESRVFLGTAFFITRSGDAITAGHAMPSPDELEQGRRLIAVVLRDGKETVCWITHAAKFEALDLALVHVNLENTKYLSLTSEEVISGTDIQILGIPSHEVSASGKEMRILKGYVTLSGKRLELNFPVPAGMSGSPLFIGTRVAGYATGMVRSEEIEEATEEIEEISNTKEIIRITEIRRMTYYGIAYPFSHLQDVVQPVLEGKTLFEFIAERNNES